MEEKKLNGENLNSWRQVVELSLSEMCVTIIKVSFVLSSLIIRPFWKKKIVPFYKNSVIFKYINYFFTYMPLLFYIFFFNQQ